MMRKEIVPGCWVDVFEEAGFKGKHRRLFGPGGIVSLRSSTGRTGIRIASVVVGERAHVRLYNASEPERCRWFVPRQGVQSLMRLEMGDELDSIQIHDRPPKEGEAGYHAFVTAVTQQKTHD